MLRKIIKIDKNKCNGCGLCVDACHEGAIVMVDGKAKLVRDDYCDGLGNCLPVCPTGAISFEEREAAAFDPTAVAAHVAKKTVPCGCPGSASRTLQQKAVPPLSKGENVSELKQWPVQLKLLSVNSQCLDGAHLLVAADCAAYARANFHAEFMHGKVTVIGCPKLDEGDYSEKLTAMLQNNDIQSVSVVRMEVPCCGGIEAAAVKALKQSGKMIPWRVMTLSVEGEVIQDK